eukprot:CAMPEP_0114235550 /NCGR_PEP_ID=MMETSP0058-20121206/6311_1 /TAXON_ID=36894 /ORGANISM="Pyramimonas parkeae, CCMP726" /LENGTH=424 /DNA_ID=CAMNT_0001347321 /DNA_START=300 /DNA_END=1574 /DNA_ORIENTATION=-
MVTLVWGLGLADTRKCPDPTIFLVTGMTGSGLQAVAKLLDAAGVFMVSGGLECEDLCGDDQVPKVPPMEACEHIPGVKNTPCSSERYDFQMNFPRGGFMIQLQKQVCYSERLVGHRDKKHERLFEEDAADMAEVLRSAHLRAASCQDPGGYVPPPSQRAHKRVRSRDSIEDDAAARFSGRDAVGNKWQAQCVQFMGLKHSNLMLHLPTMARAAYQAPGTHKVVFVVRDGRDLATATSFNRDSVDMFAKLMAAPAEGPDAVRVWGSVNRQAVECARRLFGQDNVVVVRIEEFVSSSKGARVAAVQGLLSQLGIRLPRPRLSEIADIFTIPIQAPADFLTKHYGRWKVELDPDWHETYWIAANETLSYLNYSVDPENFSLQLPAYPEYNDDNVTVPSVVPEGARGSRHHMGGFMHRLVDRLFVGKG